MVENCVPACTSPGLPAARNLCRRKPQTLRPRGRLEYRTICIRLLITFECVDSAPIASTSVKDLVLPMICIVPCPEIQCLACRPRGNARVPIANAKLWPLLVYARCFRFPPASFLGVVTSAARKGRLEEQPPSSSVQVRVGASWSSHSASWWLAFWLSVPLSLSLDNQ